MEGPPKLTPLARHSVTARGITAGGERSSPPSERLSTRRLAARQGQGRAAQPSRLHDVPASRGCVSRQRCPILGDWRGEAVWLCSSWAAPPTGAAQERSSLVDS